MAEEYLPILIIVAFVVYPFAITGLAAWIASKTGRVRFVRATTISFAILGLAIAIWFIASNGWGKYDSVTFIGSAVFVFCSASTGGLLATVVNAVMPTQSTAYSSNQK